MDLYSIPTPSYVIDRGRLEDNCRILAGVMERTGCKILQPVRSITPANTRQLSSSLPWSMT